MDNIEVGDIIISKDTNKYYLVVELPLIAGAAGKHGLWKLYCITSAKTYNMFLPASGYEVIKKQ